MSVYALRPLHATGYALLRLAAVPMLVALAACTDTDIGKVNAVPLPQALAMSHAAAGGPYVISDNDDITVRFYFDPQLDEDLRVRPDGRISLSLIGEVDAAGKTPAALSGEITQAYAKYLAKPTAVVLMRRFAGERVFVAGEVKAPGVVDMNPGRENVLQSIATVGGVTDNATLKRVIVIRRLPDNQPPLVMQLNLIDALEGKDSAQDVALMPNDLVYVPRSDEASVNLAMRLFILNNLNLSTGVSAIIQ